MIALSKIIHTLRQSILLLLAVIWVVESAAFNCTGQSTLLFEQSNTLDSEITVQEPTQDREDNDQKFKIKAQEAIVTVAHLNLTQALFFIYELKLVKEADFQILYHQVLPGHQYFHTLFRLIIAPNAP